MKVDKIIHIAMQTSGPDPEKHCILQLTAWPYVPPAFGDRAFTTLIKPYGEVDPEFVGATNFMWALGGSVNAILREAVTAQAAWLCFTDYLNELYDVHMSDMYDTFCERPSFKANFMVVHASCADLDFNGFLRNLFLNFCKEVGKHPEELTAVRSYLFS